MTKNNAIPRRQFLSQGAAAAALTIVPRHVLGRGFVPPSDLLNIAGVGVGGMGRANLINLASQNIVALCDVDWGYAGKSLDRLDADITKLRARIEAPPAPSASGAARQEFNPEKAKAQLANMVKLKTEQVPKAKRYQDYRQMLEQQKDIDAVVVATPDHMHATIAFAAMDLGKHVYVQKPLAWSVDECRRLSRRAQETKVATQMGNQGHSFNDARTAVEYIWAGAIGDVREVHIWTNRPLGFWPQGVPRPEPMKVAADTLRWNGNGVNTRLAAALAGNYPVPEGLDWNLFLGVGPPVEYHPIYHPFNWRGWTDWGVGAIGDMGAHLIDHSVWALNLGLPASVETISTPFNGASYPSATFTFYEFPARGKMPPVKLTWYDGGLLPNRPDELGEEQLNKEGGALLIGSKGKLLYDTYGLNPRLLPKSLHDSFGKPAQKLPRIAGEHHELNWVDAAKGKTAASCPFEYAARLTEVMLLGVVSLRAGTKIHYDADNMRVTNVSANDYLTRTYRNGW
ncbi:MAG TPA: Gfo/Idh/MocA family oxidoreductase [Candidatus Acidoferrum sp.]|nr:Gfo/Idh/MocA family oxidoreductase [Candidatus Acidoferrum sp.]